MGDIYFALLSRVINLWQANSYMEINSNKLRTKYWFKGEGFWPTWWGKHEINFIPFSEPIVDTKHLWTNLDRFMLAAFYSWRYLSWYIFFIIIRSIIFLKFTHARKWIIENRGRCILPHQICSLTTIFAFKKLWMVIHVRSNFVKYLFIPSKKPDLSLIILNI